MSQPSRTQQLIDQLLGEPLVDLASRMRGEGASWHALSIGVANRTDVAVTPETLRIWLAHLPGMERGTKVGAA